MNKVDEIIKEANLPGIENAEDLQSAVQKTGHVGIGEDLATPEPAADRVEGPTQLVRMIPKNGLSVTRAQDILNHFKEFFEAAHQMELEANSIVVTDESQTELMDLAAAKAKFLQNKRIQMEKVRKELKHQPLREGQTIDAVARIIKNTMEPLEKHLRNQADFVQIQEKKRIQALKEERRKILRPWYEDIDRPIDFEDQLGSMKEEQFQRIHEMAKGAWNARQHKAELEKKAKQAREEAHQKLMKENAELKAAAKLKEKELQLAREAERQEREERERVLSEQAAAEEAERLEEKRKEELELQAALQKERLPDADKLFEGAKAITATIGVIMDLRFTTHWAENVRKEVVDDLAVIRDKLEGDLDASKRGETSGMHNPIY